MPRTRSILTEWLQDLGMGDMHTLIEKALTTFDQIKSREMVTENDEGEYYLEDFLYQMEQIKTWVQWTR
jgi:signal recognition particle subunit SRP54